MQAKSQSDLPPSPATGASDWHLKLFSKSVLKQAKLRELRASIGEVSGKQCLDLGSDNGVISFYLRQAGGLWSSADLTAEAVHSITSLVGERVSLCRGDALPYEDESFDVVVVVDMLEHVEDDRVLIAELARILKSDGQLIVNAPNRKLYSPLRCFRALIGQTDEAHGHLRPGYDVGDLERIASSHFHLGSSKTYSRFFSEAIDTLIVAAYGLLSWCKGKKSNSESAEVSKGVVFTESDMKRFEKSFKLYAKIYPLVKAVAGADRVIPFFEGYMRITQLQKR